MFVWFVLFVSFGCSHSTSTDSGHSPTYLRLETSFPIDSKRVLLKNCLVNAVDVTRPAGPIKSSRGTVLEVSGRLSPGELGISGISPLWNRREGESQQASGHFANSGDPKCFLVYLVSGGDLSKNAGVVRSGFVENRQKAEEIEFRFRIETPRVRGDYVIDIRLAGEPPRSSGASPDRPQVITLWRCELSVQ